MSVKVLAAVWEDSRATGADFIVLLSMADWCDHSGCCYPSLGQIALKARVSRATVKLALRHLEDLGEIERTHLGQAPTSEAEDDSPSAIRSQRRNSYRLLVYQRKGRRVGRTVAHPTRPQVGQQLAYPPGEQVGQPSAHQPSDDVNPSTNSNAKPQVGQSSAHLTDAQDGQSSAHLSDEARAQVGQSTEPGRPIDTSKVGQSTRSHIRNEPSVDPSDQEPSVKDKSRGFAPRSAPEATPKTDDPAANLSVITRVAHEVLDLHAGQIDFIDLTEGVKERCSQLRIAYLSHVVAGAIESALVQRQLAGKPTAVSTVLQGGLASRGPVDRRAS